jgi:hypothetical protein
MSNLGCKYPQIWGSLYFWSGSINDCFVPSIRERVKSLLFNQLSSCPLILMWTFFLATSLRCCMLCIYNSQRNLKSLVVFSDEFLLIAEKGMETFHMSTQIINWNFGTAKQFAPYFGWPDQGSHAYGFSIVVSFPICWHIILVFSSGRKFICSFPLTLMCQSLIVEISHQVFNYSKLYN